jgi:hypothetical protein
MEEAESIIGDAAVSSQWQRQLRIGCNTETLN